MSILFFGKLSINSPLLEIFCPSPCESFLSWAGMSNPGPNAKELIPTFLCKNWIKTHLKTPHLQYPGASLGASFAFETGLGWKKGKRRRNNHFGKDFISFKDQGISQQSICSLSHLSLVHHASTRIFAASNSRPHSSILQHKPRGVLCFYVSHHTSHTPEQKYLYWI